MKMIHGECFFAASNKSRTLCSVGRGDMKAKTKAFLPRRRGYTERERNAQRLHESPDAQTYTTMMCGGRKVSLTTDGVWYPRQQGHKKKTQTATAVIIIAIRGAGINLLQQTLPVRGPRWLSYCTCALLAAVYFGIDIFLKYGRASQGLKASVARRESPWRRIVGVADDVGRTSRLTPLKVFKKRIET